MTPNSPPAQAASVDLRTRTLPPAPTTLGAGPIVMGGVLVLWVLVSGLDFAAGVAMHREGAWIALATVATVLAAALVASIAGFAFSAIAGAALAYVGMAPQDAVQTMVVCSIAIQLYAVWRIRASIRWRSLGAMVAAGAFAVPFGVALLARIDGSLYAICLGTFLAAYGSYSVFRRTSRAIRGNAMHDAAAGALGGLIGGLTGSPGAIVAIWCGMRGWDKLRQRATYQPYILIMQFVTLACLRWQVAAASAVTESVRYVPFALLGAVGGVALFQRMTTKQFHMVVSALLMVSGLGLLARAF